MKLIKSIAVFGTGNVMVFDEKGEQIAELQRNLFAELAERGTKAGYEMDGVIVNVQWVGNFRIRHGENGWRAVPFFEQVGPGKGSEN